jgi:glycosyltransferase involved in cell wall biosynthesis
MRILLVNNHCITDPTCGVTQSLRTLMEWLADACHTCHILTTSRFETAVPFTIHEHLVHRRVIDDHGIVADCTGRVPITLVMTPHTDENKPHARDTAQYLRRAEWLLRRFEPEMVMGCNGHPMIRTVLVQAKSRGMVTVFALRGYGYQRDHFAAVDHVFTCSRFLSDHYHTAIGLDSTPIAPPIAWAEVVVPMTERRMVTFVQPSLHKGLMVFLRLADMLYRRRPDIPVLVVESNQGLAGFGVDQVPGLHRLEPVAKPAEWLQYTKLLLVPSVWAEPFGRVAVEAMINGIPAIVSDRGGLPEAVGASGTVLPLPEWLTPGLLTLPSEADLEPWYEAIVNLWDRPSLYHVSSVAAREEAALHYGEAVSRTAHVEYLESCVRTRAQVA